MAGDRRFRRRVRARQRRPDAARPSQAPSLRGVHGVPVHGVSGVPVHGVPGEPCPALELMSSAESEGSRDVPGRRRGGGNGRAHYLKCLMQPDILAGPRYQADPPPSCLLDAMVERPRGKVKQAAYWSRVLRELPGTEMQKADRWLTRAWKHPRPEGWARPRSRSERASPPPARAERAAPTQARPSRRAEPRCQLRPTAVPEPAPAPAPAFPAASPASCLESWLSPESAGLLPGPAAGAEELLLVSKPRHEPPLDVASAWTVDCQFLWAEMDEKLEGHLGLHPAALAAVAPRLGPVLSCVLDMVAAQGTPAAAGCLQFECEDGRRASVAVLCLVADLLAALGRPAQVVHLGLEYDSHQESCPECSGRVPKDTAEVVSRLWRDLPLDPQD